MTVFINPLVLPKTENSHRVSLEGVGPHIVSNRLRVMAGGCVRSDPVRLFETLSSVGEIQSIDFSQMQIESIILVTYFDIRAARAALMELSNEFISIEPDSVYDSVGARSVRINRDSSVSLDDTMNALSKYGEIERISFSGADQLIVEFFDTRGPIAVMHALSSVVGVRGDSDNVTTISGAASRRANYTNPPVNPLLSNDNSSSSVSAHGGCCNMSSSISSARGHMQTISQEIAGSASEFEINVNSISKGLDMRTTIMIRNIPNKYSQKLLLRLIDQNFKEKYDFFYLPIDYKNKCNVGYAFINFIRGGDLLCTGGSDDDAAFKQTVIRFYQLLNNKKWEKFNSEKVCKISYARLQGQDALIDHFKASSVMQQHKQLRPYFVKSDGTTGYLGNSSQEFNGGNESMIGSEISANSSNTLTAAVSSSMVSTNPVTVEGSLYLAAHPPGLD